MANRRRCAAVYAGLMGSNLLVIPTKAYALSLEGIKQEVMYSYYSPIIFGLAAGVGCGALIARLNSKKDSNNDALQNEESKIGLKSSLEQTATQQETFDSVYIPKHANLTEWDLGGNIRVRKPVGDFESQYGDVLHTPEPAIEEHAQPSYVNKIPLVDESENKDDQTDNLEKLAQNYVKGKTDKKRKKVRSFGVAKVLGERLGIVRENMMEGIPVIQRADGSVGDVGTSWWDEAIDNSDMKRSGDFAHYLDIEDDWTAAHPLKYNQEDPLEATAASLFTQVAPQTKASTTFKPKQDRYTDVASVIDENIPFVAQEKYPEKDESKYASKEEIWQMALDALDERVDGVNAFDEEEEFFDIVGSEETLDEPDGLEQETSFIPFRTPAGHPEVVDTETYIDYLISEEFARNDSHAVRRNAREYLKVIEGGTSSHSAYVPEHFTHIKEA